MQLNPSLKMLVLALLFIVVNSTFSVYMNKCAAQKMPKSMKYTLANFGHILYGQTIVGQLVIPNDEQFCEMNQEQNFPTEVQQSNNAIKTFFLIRRGSCKFTKKILNAQKKGADMVIIYDNLQSHITTVMANDGHGHLINIPSIFISLNDGKKIISTFEQCNKTMLLKMRFDVFTSEVVKLALWLDSNNRETFIMIRDFYRDYYNVLKNKISTEVRFKIYHHCRGMCNKEDCIFMGSEYCLISNKIISGVRLQGDKIIHEHLRSYYLFEQLKSLNDTEQMSKWWQYMNIFDKNLCIEKLDIKTCSLDIMKQFYDTNIIENKVMTAIKEVNQGVENPANPLRLWVQESRKSDILFYPQASINKRNFYGLFRAPDIFEMICQSLQKPPSQCHNFQTSNHTDIFQDQSSNLWTVIGIIIGIMLITFLAALFVYTRLVKKQINQQISLEVNKMVEHYVTLSEEQSKSNAAIS